jgi:hypothetical protein
VSLLSSIGSAKNCPLGIDGDNNIYWCFSGSKALYVCSTVLTESGSSSSQDSNYSHGTLEHSSAFMQPLIAPEEHSSKFLMSGLKYISPSSTTLLDNNSSSRHYSTLSNIVKNNLSQVDNVSQLRHWWVYEKEQDVGGLIAWLNIKYVRHSLPRRCNTQHYFSFTYL